MRVTRAGGTLGAAQGSIHYLVLPGLRRAELLGRPQVLADTAADAPAWGRLVTVA